jgi:formylglycine-generating enzyme required for sulfatase activity
MDLRKAYETLGLVRGASPKEVEAAYQRLRAEIEARLSRVQSGAVSARYQEVRRRLDTARETLLAAPQVPRDEPLAHAFEVLGLTPNASPLDVASAYVTLCEEIERELRDASTEDLRRACLEARADVDAAYQRAALSPLRDVAGPAGPGGRAARYETQMAAEPFSAPQAQEVPAPVLRIEPEDRSASQARGRRRRRGLRRIAVAASVSLLLAGIGFAAVSWSGIDPRVALARYVPADLDRYVPTALVQLFARPGPPPELAEARTAAEALRRRVSDERTELQSRVDEIRTRADELERSWSAAADPVERERMAAELDRVRARRDLLVQHAELVERHVLASTDLTVAYGKMERAEELAAAGEPELAIEAFAEARGQLEDALVRLDVVEEAVGARSEAEAGFEAWRALATEAALTEIEPAARGTEVLVRARELLADGDFDAAVPELRRAAQHFAAALAEGRKQAAAARAEEEQNAAAPTAQDAAGDGIAAREAEPDAAPDAGSDAIGSVARADAPAEPDLAEIAAGVVTPAVSSPPPDRERAAIKLVLIPAGEFLYGCNDDLDLSCGPTEAPGRRVGMGAFRIDRTEVRVNEYAACVSAGSCAPPAAGGDCNWGVPERGDHPVNCVDRRQASAYCAWVGKRLPTEREWEKAARGSDGRLYPWGNSDPSCEVAVIADAGSAGCGRASTSPVASLAEGRSPFGLFDMAGNVLEWTASDDGGTSIVRGGSWRGDAAPARASSRERAPSGARDPRIGFRCAADDGLFANR